MAIEWPPPPDAGEAIYSAALLETELERLLRTYMPGASNNLARRLFEGYGPLNTFSAKIDLARALGLIDEEIHRDLGAVQKIRNAFAHPRERLNFKSAEIAQLAMVFKDWQAGCDVEDLFSTRVVNLMAELDMKTNALVVELYGDEEGA